MDKGTIVEQIVELSRGAGKREVTQLQVRYVLNTFGMIAVDTMRAGEYVQAFGLGKLVPTITKPRTGRHPRTGQPLFIPGRTTIRLHLLRKLKKGL